YSRGELLHISTDSLTTAGTIILLTGAGGAFKQLLIDTGAGETIANAVKAGGMSPLVFAFLLALIVRVLQGSATVAMITGAGLVAPVLDPEMSPIQLALIVIAIASGATALSHVNDSGFWLVNRYLGLTEKQTLQSWTLLTTVVGGCGLLFCLVVWWFV
ncbi:MAG: gluconate transporter, partial [Bacteroidota bacterium]